MKKRLISRKRIKKAYTKEVEDYSYQPQERQEKKVEDLPDEMFQILGQVISFIEEKNKQEGEKK